jgi:pimeloyl-ACP methyl ester carboxylesterase
VGSVTGVPTIERDGVRLAYVESGAGDPPVVLLHGMACRHDHMLPVVRHLESRHRCLAFDLRGHGASDAPHGAYAMDDFVGDLGAVVDRLAPVRPILIGHSFGGSIALAYADRFPDRIAALVMLDSGMRSNQVLTADLGPFYAELRSGDDARYRATLTQFVHERLVDPVDGDSFATSVADMMVSVPSHVFLSMSDTVQQLRSAEMAARCTLPALLVLSRQDFAEPAAVAALGGNWHVGRAVGAGHFVQVGVPDQVNAMIDRFLELTFPRSDSPPPA